MRRHSVLSGAVVVLAVCGAWLSGELLSRHDDIWRLKNPPGTLVSAICGAGGRLGLDCKEAANDRWAEIGIPRPSVGGRPSGATVRVPVPFLGVAYFSFVAIWFGCVGWPRGRRLWDCLPVAVTLAGLTGSAFFLALMVTGRTRPCPPCIAVHLLNLLIVIVAWRLWRVRGTSLAQQHCSQGTGTPEDIRTRESNGPHANTATVDRPLAGVLSTRHALTALTFWVVMIAGCWLYRADHLALAGQWSKLVPYKQVVTALREDERFLLQQYLAEPPRPACTTQPGDTRPHLIAFIDYECPNCSCSLTALIENARRTFPDLEVQVRHFPLCSECNPDVKTAFHSHACLAAYAAEAARSQGGETAFWKMHELLVQRRGKLDAEQLVELGREAGLDTQRFARDLAGNEVRQRVAADVEAGRQAGVTGTPAVFFQARRVDPRFEGPTFWKALAGQFSSTATSSPAPELSGKVASLAEDK